MLTSFFLAVLVHLLAWGLADLQDSGPLSCRTRDTNRKSAVHLAKLCRAQYFCSWWGWRVWSSSLVPQVRLCRLVSQIRPVPISLVWELGVQIMPEMWHAWIKNVKLLAFSSMETEGWRPLLPPSLGWEILPGFFWMEWCRGLDFHYTILFLLC